MKTRVSIIFWARKKRGEDAQNPHHKVHIVCRLSARGEEVNVHTDMETVKSNWLSNGEHSRVKGKTPADRLINVQLTKLVDTLNDLHADLERQGKPVTARRLWELYKHDGAALNMLGLAKAFLTERETLIGHELKQSSFDAYKGRHEVVRAFLEASKLLDLRPEEFSHTLADKFLHWCLKERGYTRNYFRKVIQYVIQCLRWGVRREQIGKNPLDFYECKAHAAKELVYLSAGELQALTAFDFPLPHLDRTRDLFVFQCWTGLAFADLAALDVRRSAEYHRDGQGTMRRVLRVKRAKSTLYKNFECVIPLLPEAERILAKYGDKLPAVPGNATYNQALKDMGWYLGLSDEQMTTHVGRKTAGVMMLNLGIRMETVSKFLGHSSVKMTEKLYAKILDTTVVDDFSKLFAAAGPAAPLAPAPTVYQLPSAA